MSTTNDRTQELSKVPKVTALPEGCSVAIIDKSGAVLESIEADKFFQAVRDSIQIGGRNLLKGTSSEWKPQAVLNTAYTAPLIHIKDLGLKAGDRVILSMYIKPSTEGKKLRSRIEFYNSDSNRKSVCSTEVTDICEYQQFMRNVFSSQLVWNRMARLDENHVSRCNRIARRKEVVAA